MSKSAYLEKKPRIVELDYELEDGTPFKGTGIVIAGLIKSVSNKERFMKNRKKTPFRIAIVESMNPKTKQLERKPAQIISALYTQVEDSFAPDSEVEVLLQFDASTKRTYGKVQLPELDSFNYADYAPAEAVTETA